MTGITPRQLLALCFVEATVVAAVLFFNGAPSWTVPLVFCGGLAFYVVAPEWLKVEGMWYALVALPFIGIAGAVEMWAVVELYYQLKVAVIVLARVIRWLLRCLYYRVELFVVVRIDVWVARSMAAEKFVAEGAMEQAKEFAAIMRRLAKIALDYGMAVTAKIALQTAEMLERELAAVGGAVG